MRVSSWEEFFQRHQHCGSDTELMGAVASVSFEDAYAEVFCACGACWVYFGSSEGKEFDE